MGKNLIVVRDILLGKWINNTGAEQDSVYCISTGWIPVTPGEKISLSYWQPESTHEGNNRMWSGSPMYYKSDKTYLSGYETVYFNDTHKVWTETVPANAAYVRATLQIPRGMASDLGNTKYWTSDSPYKWQIEKGAATDWKPSGLSGYGHITVTSIEDASRGLGMKVNYSAFGTANPGECYIHGFQDDLPADVDGYVMWNGVRRTVPKTMVNPNTGVPYNKTIYIVMRLSSASATTGTLYNVWYNSGWKYGAISAPTAAAWTWAETTDIVLGQYVEPSSDGQIVDAYLYWPPKKAPEVWQSESAYEKAAAAQTTANSANTNASTAINRISAGGTSTNLLMDVYAENFNAVNGPGSRYLSDASNTSTTGTFVTESGLPDPNAKCFYRITTTESGKSRGYCFYANGHPPVTPGNTYRVSCFARANSGSPSLYFTVGNVGKDSGKFYPTSVWKRYEWTFTLTEAVSTSDINYRIYFYSRGDIGVLDMCGFSLVQVEEDMLAVQTSAANANDKIDNLQIGGRNLFKDSEFLGNSWTKENCTVSDGVVTLTPSASDIAYRFYQMPANGYWEWEANQSYTFSIDAKASANGLTFYFNAVGLSKTSSKIPLTTEWKRYSFTTSSASASTGNMSFFADRPQSGTVYFRKPKLEKGTRATDWTPAPEDVITTIEEIQIGGRNLYIDSNAPSLSKVAAVAGRYFSNSGASDTSFSGTIVPITDPPVPGIAYGAKEIWDGTRTTNYNHILATSSGVLNLIEGRTYIASFWGKLVSGNCDVMIQLGASPYEGFTFEVKGTGWQHYEQIFTYTTAKHGTLPRLYTGAFYKANTACEFCHCGYKIEEGNKSTTWSLAPEDTEYELNVIRQTAEKAKYQTEVIVGTQTATTAAWTGVASFATLVDMQSILYWLPQTAASNVTLNLTLSDGSTTGAIPCYYSGTTRLGTHYGAGNAVRLLYRENVTIGSTTVAKGWWADANYDSNTYDRIRHYAKITAKSAITAGMIVVANSDTTYRPLTAAAFDLTKPILYAGTTLAANAEGDNNYIVFPNINLTTTKSGFSGTDKGTVYIVGTIAGNLFTPNSTILTTTVPTSDDGLYYIALGRMRSTTNFDLYPEHPVYRFYNGKFESTQQMAYEAFVQAKNAQSDIDGLEIGGRNLLAKTNVLPEVTTFTESDYVYQVSAGKGAGLKFPSTLFTVGEKYVLSFKFKKISGTLTFIGGYCAGFTALASGFTVDGTVSTRTYASGYALADNENTHSVVVCLTYNGGTNNNNLYIQPNRGGYTSDNTSVFQIWDLKLEKGNRPTDWTPAPEDTVEALNTMQTTLKGQIDQKVQTWYQSTNPATWAAADRSAHDGDLWCYTGSTTSTYTKNNIYRYNASNNTWTSYAANGDLFDKADGKTTIFYGKTSGTYTGVATGDYLVDSTDGTSYRWTGSAWVKVTDYQEAIANIRIGGRNLLLWTGTLRKGTDAGVNGKDGITTYRDTELGSLTETTDGIKLTSTGVTHECFAIPLANNGSIETGEDAVLSFDARGNLTAAGQFYWIQASGANISLSNWLNGSSSVSLSTTAWTHFEVKINTTNANIRTCTKILMFYNLGSASSGKWIELRKGSVKLEHGKHATDWTPAPEDVITTIEEIQIGGRNLYIDSNAPSTVKVAAVGSRYFSDSAASDATFSGTIVPITDPPVPGITYGTKEVWDGTRTNNARHPLATATNAIKLIEGRTYIASFWGKLVSGNCDVMIQLGASPYEGFTFEVKGTGWQHYEQIFTYTTAKHGTGARLYTGAYSYANTACEFWHCGYKIEEGNKSTTWSLAPEDTEYELNVIRQTAEKAKYQTEVIVGTQTATTAAWTGVASFATLVDMQSILYWLPIGSAENVTLNLTLSDGSTTGAIPCYYSGTSRLGTHYAAGNAVRLLYRENVTIGSTTIAKGWWADANYNTNNVDRIQHTSAITAKTAITAGHMIAADASGQYSHIAASTAFDITKPILYAASAIEASATGTNNYLVLPNLNLATSKSGFTGTSQYTVYIVGTLNGSLFTPNSTLYTTAAPTSDNGLFYIALGRMRSTTNFDLYPEHPIFRYYKGKFQTTEQMAYEAFVQADHAQSDIDGLEIGGRNLLPGTSDEWVSTTIVDGTNKSVNIVPTSQYLDIPGLGFKAGDVIQVSFDIKFTNFAATGTGTKNSIVQGTANVGGSWGGLNFAATGNGTNRKTELEAIMASSSKEGHINTWFVVTSGMVDGTYSGKTTINIRFDYYAGTVSMRRIMIEKGTKPTEWRPAPEDFENHLVEETTKVYTNAVSNSEGFFNSAIKEYVRTSDLNTFKQNVSTQFNQTAESVEMIFNNAVSMVNALSADTSGEFTEIKKYIRFVDGAIVLGQEENPLILKLVNNRISFQSNGTEVAYFSDNRMAVDNVTVVNSLDLLGLRITKDTSGNIFIG